MPMDRAVCTRGEGCEGVYSKFCLLYWVTEFYVVAGYKTDLFLMCLVNLVMETIKSPFHFMYLYGNERAILDYHSSG